MLVVVCSEKGGVGKSTIATQLGAMCALKGVAVLLVDTDRRNSTAGWAALRRANAANPVAVPCETLRHRPSEHPEVFVRALLALHEGYDVVIVDCAGEGSVEMRATLAVCDRAIVPLRTGTFDGWVTNDMADILTTARAQGKSIDASTVISAAPDRAGEVRRTIDALQTIADIAPRLDTVIYDRAAVQAALDAGLCVLELPDNRLTRKARAEFSSLYREVFRETA